MNSNHPDGRGLWVIKIGGGLAAVPGSLDQVCRTVSHAARRHRILIIPGGGPFADAVRTLQKRMEISDETAHWMAILAMDQYALALAERMEGCVVLDEPGQIATQVVPGRIGILAPARWMRHADVLPRSWGVTSDSIAAFVAGAVDAASLVLIKPSRTASAVDPYFQAALPAHLPHHIIGADQLEELQKLLNGSTAAGGSA